MNDFLIGVELTRHCNLRCTHCFRAHRDQPAEIPFDVLASVLEQAKRYSKPLLALTGGETTLHSRFFDIVELIVSLGFPFHYVTNGYNFEAVFRRLHPLFGNPLWRGVSLSLDGASEEVHDRIRGKGSFARVLGGMAVARTHNLETVVQMVVHRENRQDMTELALLCSKMGVNRLYIAHLQPTPGVMERDLLPTREEALAIEREVSDLQGQFRMPIILSAGYFDDTSLAHCRFLKNGALTIDCHGRLTACCQISNMEGAEGEEDVICDLRSTPLTTAHSKLLQTYQDLLRFRLAKMESSGLSDVDRFHCWTCLKYFHKVDWMRNYPHHDWVKNDPYFQRMQAQ